MSFINLMAKLYMERSGLYCKPHSCIVFVSSRKWTRLGSYLSKSLHNIYLIPLLSIQATSALVILLCLMTTRDFYFCILLQYILSILILSSLDLLFIQHPLLQNLKILLAYSKEFSCRAYNIVPIYNKQSSF